MAKTFSGKEVMNILIRELGFSFVSQKGSHVKLRKKTRGKPLPRLFLCIENWYREPNQVKSMEDTLKYYKEARKEFLATVAEFPVNLREKPLFGEWNLKDVFAHIMGWETLSIEKVEAVKKGITPNWVSDAEEQNRMAVENCRGISWDEMYQKLVQSGADMIVAYQSLPENLWDKQAGPDPKFTPRHFLLQEARHYETHLNEIEKVCIKRF